MVRAAAKNFRDVLVVVDPADYDRVLAALASPGGPSVSTRFDLARSAIAHTAAYDTMIASTLQEVTVDDASGEMTRGAAGKEAKPGGASAAALPAIWQPRLVKLRDLRYGENPHQTAAWYATEHHAEGFGGATVHRARSCRTRICSTSTPPPASRSSSTSRRPSSSIDTNPCGVATRGPRCPRPTCAPGKADALSAFGGIVGLTRPIDADTAQRAQSSHSSKPSSRQPSRAVTMCGRSLRPSPTCGSSQQYFTGLEQARDAQSILGAWLVQTRDRVTEAGGRVAER